ncbi:hypothetical protein B0H13DRAFT_1910868 [Mycena leptocephala]|nr:hypothetical protein B0H13DRAFT_1910868 [Mycena leptocephala]
MTSKVPCLQHEVEASVESTTGGGGEEPFSYFQIWALESKLLSMMAGDVMGNRDFDESVDQVVDTTTAFFPNPGAVPVCQNHLRSRRIRSAKPVRRVPGLFWVKFSVFRRQASYDAHVASLTKFVEFAEHFQKVMKTFLKYSWTKIWGTSCGYPQNVLGAGTKLNCKATSRSRIRVVNKRSTKVAAHPDVGQQLILRLEWNYAR